MEAIIVAVIGGIFSLLAALIGKRQEGNNELIIGLFLGACIIGAFGFGIFLVNREEKTPDNNGGVVISAENSDGSKSNEIDSDKNNEENITISEEEFNAKNEYKIIWASNDKNIEVYEELNRIKDIVKPYFIDTSIEEVFTGKYSLVIDDGNGKSIKELEDLKVKYNKILQKIAIEPDNRLKYQIDRDPIVYIRNEYIDNAILNMKREYNNGNYEKSERIKQDIEAFILDSEYYDKFKHYKDELNLM